MALLLTSPLFSFSLSSSSTSRIPIHPCFRLCQKSIALHPKSYIGGRIQTPFVLNSRGTLIVKALSDVDGVDSTSPESPTPASDGPEKSVSVEKLPLESKLQEKLEKQTRMKLAKKLRLRRKRLVQKRHMRKKGRWPPSKVKKHKNV
ncbi:hypothetical protein ACS0TY_024704 [Phlomoides rotata]